MPSRIEGPAGEISPSPIFARPGAIWHGQKAWNGIAILARGSDPVETRRGLPGDPEDLHSRYIEAAVGGLTIGCLYLPNGNPAPGPKFDYKLAWFERLQKYGTTLIASDAPFIMAGDYNVMPTDLDVYAPERWRDDALFRPEVRKAYAEFVKLGWKDALRHLYPGKRIYTFWKYFRNAFARDAGLCIDHLLLSPSLKNRLVAGGVAREVRSWEKPAITRRRGSNWRISPRSAFGRKRGIDGGETRRRSWALGSHDRSQIDIGFKPGALRHSRRCRRCRSKAR